MQRRAQVTVFIILGVVLLVAVSVYLYVQTQTTQKTLEEAQVPVVKEVPVEFQPVNSYVETCMAQVGVEALQKLGSQGGYIDPLKYGLRTNPVNPTEADAVEFVTGSGVIVPYWFYLKSNNRCDADCQFQYNRPHLFRSEGEPSIEGQLDDYMNTHLADCLKDFSVLKAKGYGIEQAGQIKTTTDIFAKDLGFLIEFPLKITKGSSVHKIDSFFLRVPLDLRSIYEQATLITNIQAQYKFLEKDLLNLVVGYSGVDEKKLPPMAATEFEFGSGKVWTKSQVKSLVQQVLVRDMPALQVYGSRNFKPVVTGDAFRDTLYNSGMLVKSDKTFPNLNVEFNYLDFWPIYFNLNCYGETCKPESASSNLVSLIGVQRYNFLYDVSYPILIAISDPSALNNKGYQFQFFLEANVRDNEPMNYSYFALESAVPGTSSMMCDLDKRNSGNIAITVKNSLDKSLLNDVEVVYTCAEESCSMAKTTNGVLNTPFPVCLGGVVSFFKDGFVASSKYLSTELGKADSLGVELLPLKTFDVAVQKYMLVKADKKWVLRDNPVPLDKDEQLVLDLNRIPELGDEEYSTAINVNSSSNSVQLAAGNYVIEASVLLNKPITIRPQQRCENSGLSKNCYTVPQETLTIGPPAYVGGISSNYTFSTENIQKKKVTFYVITVDIADIPEEQRVIEDLDQLSKIGDYSYSYQTLLKPRFE